MSKLAEEWEAAGASQEFCSGVEAAEIIISTASTAWTGIGIAYSAGVFFELIGKKRDPLVDSLKKISEQLTNIYAAVLDASGLNTLQKAADNWSVCDTAFVTLQDVLRLEKQVAELQQESPELAEKRRQRDSRKGDYDHQFPDSEEAIGKLKQHPNWLRLYDVTAIYSDPWTGDMCPERELDDGSPDEHGKYVWDYRWALQYYLGSLAIRCSCMVATEVVDAHSTALMEHREKLDEIHEKIRGAITRIRYPSRDQFFRTLAFHWKQGGGGMYAHYYYYRDGRWFVFKNSIGWEGQVWYDGWYPATGCEVGVVEIYSGRKWASNYRLPEPNDLPQDVYWDLADPNPINGLEYTPVMAPKADAFKLYEKFLIRHQLLTRWHEQRCYSELLPTVWSAAAKLRRLVGEERSPLPNTYTAWSLGDLRDIFVVALPKRGEGERPGGRYVSLRLLDMHSTVLFGEKVSSSIRSFIQNRLVEGNPEIRP